MVDKPEGKSSFWAVSKVKRLLSEKKAGHAGTLDPLATGVLVIGLGFATRVLKYIESFDKEYTGVIQFGVTTDTDDSEGLVTGTSPVPVIQREKLVELLCSFTGKLSQTPPAYSAIKINGERAYKKARRGEPFEIKPRDVVVHSIELLEWDMACSRAKVKVRCSKGTYIRSLARDLGTMIGCGAHLTGLRRDRVGSYSLSQAIRLDESASAESLMCSILPIETALIGLPCFTADQKQEERFLLGREVVVNTSSTDLPGDVLVKTETGMPICLCRMEVSRDGFCLKPIRMLKSILEGRCVS